MHGLFFGVNGSLCASKAKETKTFENTSRETGERLYYSYLKIEMSTPDRLITFRKTFFHDQTGLRNLVAVTAVNFTLFFR
jgi:hypothetical protein